MARRKAIRTVSWAALAAGIAAPLLRRRLHLHPTAVAAASSAAPFALCVVRPRTATRDVLTCCLQMWAYLAVYEMPHDDPEALRRRVHVDYAVRLDLVLGAGALPTARLQRRLARPGITTRFDRILVWSHWLWFLVPHSALAYVLVRRPELFPRAAALTYGVFDVGVLGYWLVPTAPPWYAAPLGRIDTGMPPLRRMMYEYGEEFWGGGWEPLYSLLGGNPLAAMPSLHFATTVMAAHLLSDVGVAEGTVGWAYVLLLGLALVYLGEHYVVDLVAGLALTEAVRRSEPWAAPVLGRVSAGVQRLEAAAR